MPSSRKTSPASSQGVNSTRTPLSTQPRRSRSVCSAKSNTSLRLTTLVSDSFKLTPIAHRQSVLNDETDIEIHGRKAWWDKLGENSRDVMDVLDNGDIPEVNNIAEEFDVEILSQEKKNYSTDLPESSDGESINSIVIPQRKLFTQKEIQSQKKFGHIIDNRETLAKLQKSHIDEHKAIKIAPKNLFNLASKPRTKPAFPAALLNISSKTVNKTNEMPTAEVNGQVRNLFGNRLGNKRKNMFADFIVSESEDEIPDIQPKLFGFQNNKGQKRRESSASDGIAHASASTIDLEMDDWKQLPSSTMVENQLEEAGTTPVKRAKISKLSEPKETVTTNTNITVNKTKQSIKSKNTSKSNINLSSTSKMNNEFNEENNHTANNSNNFIQSISDKGLVHRESETTNTNSAVNITKLSNKLINSRNKSINTSKSNINLNLTSEINNKYNEENNHTANNSNNFRLTRNKSKSIRESSNNENNHSKITNKSKNPLKLIQNIADKSLVQEDHKSQHDIDDDDDDDEDFTLEYENDDEQLNPTKINKSDKINEKESYNQLIEGDNYDKNTTAIERHIEKVLSEDDLKEKTGNKKETNEKIKTQNDRHKQDNSNNHIEEQDNSNNHIEEQDNSNNHIEEQVEPNEQQNQSLMKDNDKKENDRRNYDTNQPKDIVKLKKHTLTDDHNDSDDQSEPEKSREAKEGVDANQSLNNEPNESNGSEHEESIEAEEEEEINESLNNEENDSNQAEPEESREVEEDVDTNQSVNNEPIENNVSEHEESIEADEEKESDESLNNEENDSNQTEDEEAEEEIDTNQTLNDEQSDNDEAEEEAGESDSETDERNETKNQEVSVDAESDDNQQNESNLSQSENIQEEESMESEQEQSDVDDNEVAGDEIVPDESDDQSTTGRHRKKNETIVKSPEAILHEKISDMESSTAKGRRTSIRKTKSIIKNINIRPSLAPVRESTGLTDGTRDSSAEGSGWDSHRTTRKTIRLTMGKDFTLRKSLRALVMEKSAKQYIEVNEEEMNAENTKIPLANSTELPAFESYQETEHMHVDETVEEPSDHEVSARTKQTTLELYLQKIKEETIERKRKTEEKVRAYLKAPPKSTFHSFKMPQIPVKCTKVSQNKPKPKQTKSSLFPLDMLPPEVLEDMKYKPPKRFQPCNASWITKRLYKYIEDKLEPKYDYKARVRAERFMEMLYEFSREARKVRGPSDHAVDTLKKEMARLNIIKTHFEFYCFFNKFMPREIRIRVVPDVVNKISLPKTGIFSDILQ